MQSLRRSRGFTLIELMVVVGLAAILLALAAPSFIETRYNQKLASASNDLYASLMQARNEALNLNRRVTVAPMTGGDWKTGWQIYVDMNNNDSFESTTDTFIVSTPALDDSFTITNATGGTPVAKFTFDSRGFLRGNTAATVTFNSSKTPREKRVIVDVTGRGRVCDPKLSGVCTGT